VSPLAAAPLFVVSLAITLTAARLFARRLDRLGIRFGLAEAAVGLLTALAADGPEISAALVAVAKGAHNVGVGVIVGSNIFNLAAMIGLSAIIAGSVRLPRETLWLEGLTGSAATLLAVAVLLGWIPAVPAILALACVLIPYVALIARGPRLLSRLPLAGGLAGGLGRALGDRQPRSRARVAFPDPTHHLVGLIVLDVGLIVAGSTGMVQSALTLSDHWQISRPVLGVLILAPLTSIPNAITAWRLGVARRGSALVSETFNSNTLNLAAGVTAPALFVSLAGLSGTEKAGLGWLIAMTAVSLLLLGPAKGMRRPGALVVLSLYLGFVAFQLASA